MLFEQNTWSGSSAQTEKDFECEPSGLRFLLPELGKAHHLNSHRMIHFSAIILSAIIY